MLRAIIKKIKAVVPVYSIVFIVSIIFLKGAYADTVEVPPKIGDWGYCYVTNPCSYYPKCEGAQSSAGAADFVPFSSEGGMISHVLTAIAGSCGSRFVSVAWPSTANPGTTFNCSNLGGRITIDNPIFWPQRTYTPVPTQDIEISNYALPVFEICNLDSQGNEVWTATSLPFFSKSRSVTCESTPISTQRVKLDPTTGQIVGPCVTQIDELQNMGNTCPHCPPKGDPVHVGTGNVFLEEVDYRGAGPFPLLLSRHYNSSTVAASGSAGQHWRTSYDRSLRMAADTLTEIYRPDGMVNKYQYSNNAWTAMPDITDRLVEITDGAGNRTGWRYILADDTVEEYNMSGQLVLITNRAGLTQTLVYDLDSAQGGDGNPETLDTVTDNFGRKLSFTYDTSGRISTLTDPAGGIYSYAYDVNGNLLSVTYPDGTPGDNSDNPARTYHYEDPNFNHALTGITDENGNRIATWGYDTKSRAVFSEHAGGTERVDLVYNADGTTTVTDSLGHSRTYHFQYLHGVVQVTQVDGDPCTDCGDYADTTYDANGFISSRTDFNGVTTTYVHDARGLETSRTEAVGTPQERTITTQWDPVFRLPLQITEPGKITTFTYDAQGRLLERKEEAAP